ncbi:hypothetical protein KR074_011839, partial [Drosophila pseudoananassae]
NLEVFINVIKCAFGTGCLAMPRAFHNTGWLTGLVSTFLVSFLVVYAMNVLLAHIHHLGKIHGNPYLSYRKTLEFAVNQGPRCLQFAAKPLGILVDFLLGTYHFGVLCVYVIFVAKSMKYLLDLHYWLLDERLYMALLIFPLVLTFLVPNLKYLVPFALIANILMFFGYFIILCYLVRDLPDFADIPATRPLKTWPLFFGTVLFAIESVGVILALERNMRTPERYLGPCGILNQAMALVVIFYAAFGFLGYWRFGQNTSNSILQDLPASDTLVQLVSALFALGIFFSYALQGSVTVDIIWKGYLEPNLEEGSGRITEMLVRIALVIASVLVAIEYPDFGLILSLTGSFCLAQLGLIFPGIVDFCVCYVEGYGPGNVLLLRSFTFIFMGFAGGVAGTVASLQALNLKYPFLRF